MTSTATTLGAVADIYGVTIEEHLARDLDVPVLGGMQRQGDVLIAPARPGADPGAPIPAAGVPVVRGEAGGNTHSLHGDGRWRPAAGGGQILGTVTVDDGAAVWLLHPEHGAMGIAPGCYTVRRQREQAEEIRMVTD